MMKNLIIMVPGTFLLFTSLVFAQVDGQRELHDRYFKGKQGCFLLFNLKTNAFEQEIGGESCREQFVACSTFKVPLAVMAFDAGILKDADQVLKWDGVIEERDVVNKDHNARTWMKDSVVWFSKRLTPLMGEEKFRQYLRDFNYGNQDITAGLTEAWLVAPSESGPALKISAYEQVEFMTKLWRDELPVSKSAMRIARELTYLETSDNGWALNGKTGSNIFNRDPQHRLGWFIAHVTRDDQSYIAVTRFHDIAFPSEDGYAGPKAKEITKQILSDLGLW